MTDRIRIESRSGGGSPNIIGRRDPTSRAAQNDLPILGNDVARISVKHFRNVSKNDTFAQEVSSVVDPREQFGTFFFCICHMNRSPEPRLCSPL
jgi:hypothetical protein